MNVQDQRNARTRQAAQARQDALAKIIGIPLIQDMVDRIAEMYISDLLEMQRKTRLLKYQCSAFVSGNMEVSLREAASRCSARTQVLELFNTVFTTDEDDGANLKSDEWQSLRWTFVQEERRRPASFTVTAEAIDANSRSHEIRFTVRLEKKFRSMVFVDITYVGPQRWHTSSRLTETIVQDVDDPFMVL